MFIDHYCFVTEGIIKCGTRWEKLVKTYVNGRQWMEEVYKKAQK